MARETSGTVPDDLESATVTRLRAANGLLFCTDFDGTLAPIETDPGAATIPEVKKRLLETLRDHENVRVAVISGRELGDLRERVGLSGIDYAGNHGLEFFSEGETTVHPVAAKRARELERIVTEVENELADTECFVEDKSVSATVHYREAPEREKEVHAVVNAAVERVSPDGFEVSVGKAILELTPAVAWNKGSVVSMLAADHDAWLTVYIGDDTTDEAAFEALADHDIGVHVGLDEETAAEFRLADPAAVEAFLGWLCTTGFDALDGTEDADADDTD